MLRSTSVVMTTTRRRLDCAVCPGNSPTRASGICDEVSVLLIRERLEGGRVDRPGTFGERLR